ncbi:uncharacterized protein LOC108666374 [Hyalella azteca]|uniref:Uncharacterized protein LOC108666374 n=1 Tax=Hyalella azteca TaxID=294128 RepID=A0A8B7N4F3_HYAAZ|nr:uncharacterized protein LOC108666374 [Hyalella azteca]
MAAAVTEAKPRQLQVARLLQEEEESWISSEELYTDGSSDEELAKGSSGRSIHSSIPHQSSTSPRLVLGMRNARRPFPSPGPPATASEPAVQDAPHLTETTRRLSMLGLHQEAPRHPAAAAGADRCYKDRQDKEMEEQEDIMLWRPKRGSLKLPHIDLSGLQSSARLTCDVAIAEDGCGNEAESCACETSVLLEQPATTDEQNCDYKTTCDSPDDKEETCNTETGKTRATEREETKESIAKTSTTPTAIEGRMSDDGGT